MRISNSYCEQEIAVMEALCRAESMRPNSTMARSKAFASLYRKAKQMGDRVKLANHVEHEGSKENG